MAMAAIDFQLLANAGFPPATYSSGETIFAAGDKGDKMYVIRSGEVRSSETARSLRNLAQGEFSAKWR